MVRAETGIEFDYRLGIMVETPRAALRDDITRFCFRVWDNDLTQMTMAYPAMMQVVSCLICSPRCFP